MSHPIRKTDLPTEAHFESASGILTINLAALCRNYASLAKRLAPALSGAVVKANAYGLGARIVSKALYAEGCRHFFVAQFGEALELRKELPAEAMIVVLNGLQPGAEIECAELGIVPVLNSMEQFSRYAEAAIALHESLPAVLQFDTGMSRLGFPPEELAHLKSALSTADFEIRFLMSHLASADDPENSQNVEQCKLLETIAQDFPGFETSFANSAGILLGKKYHGALARPGIALFGAASSIDRSTRLEPVVELAVPVIQVRTVQPGTRIGYGGTAIATTEMRLATVAAGYADGLPRSLSHRGAVYFNGVRLPIVGRISMDSTMVDVSALPHRLKLGDLVEVIGRNQSVDDLAHDAGTISYEILTAFGERFYRRYI